MDIQVKNLDHLGIGDSRRNKIPAIQLISRRSSQMIGTLLNCESLVAGIIDQSLMRQDFACPKGYRSAYAADARKAADKLSRNWKYHSLESVEIETHAHYNTPGRPTKNQSPEHFTYRVTAQVIPIEL